MHIKAYHPKGERETLRERDAFYKRRDCYMFLRGEKHDLFLFALVFLRHLLPISNVRFRGRGSPFQGELTISI